VTLKPKTYRDVMRAICPHGYTVGWRMLTGAPTPGCDEHGWTEATARQWAARELTAAQLARQPVITIGDDATADPAAIPPSLAVRPSDGSESPGGPRIPGWRRTTLTGGVTGLSRGAA
jgi:hypothetical protein